MSSAIGIDLGGTKCLAVALDEAGRVVAEHRVPTPEGAEAVLGTLEEVVQALGGSDRIGVGVPGLVDRAGVLRFAPNLPGVVELDVRGELLERFPDATVRVDNDATCATWAETRVGAGRNLEWMVMITLGTGIGGGVVSGGKLERGAHGFAGEFGHMVVAPEGEGCVCGQQGCWEFFASGRALGRFAREAAAEGRAGRVLELAGGDPDRVRGEHVTQACHEGDEWAAEILRRVGWWLGVGLVNLAMAFDPQAFVIGGGLGAAGEPLLGPARATMHELLAGVPHRTPPDVLLAELGEHAGAVGAALLAVDECG
ncbi:MAG TPA: ROK family protein [Acidimicrobiales bacterium]|nr:ROK family protein [Acidimicrobiales bacterium]